MSFTLDETTYNSPNYTPASQVLATYGRPREIEGVTIHHWGDPAQNPTFSGSAAYLCRPGGNTSAHFVAEAGRVACLVSPENAAWHAGSATGNATTIGIEMNPRCSEGDVQTLVELISWLEDIHGPLTIYLHREWSSTACPGRYASRRDEIVRRVNAHHQKTPTKPAGTTPAPSKGNNIMASAYPSKLRGFNGKEQGPRTVLDWFHYNTLKKLENIERALGATPFWGAPEVKK